mmetsp:Transcript_2055/g.3084  ORF Transcript_2055/g.3084 Transcript_2055/m.3084 type:complete len:97 (+) Transcript_2055:339-629(+)
MFLLITTVTGLVTQADYAMSDGFLLYYHSWALIGLTNQFLFQTIFSFIKIFYEEVYVLTIWLLVSLGVTTDQLAEFNETVSGVALSQPSVAFLLVL